MKYGVNFLGSLILLFFSVYIFYIGIIDNTITIYTNKDFVNLMIFSAFLGILLSMINLMYNLIYNKVFVKTKIQKTKSTISLSILIFFLILVGIIINPFLLILCLFLIFSLSPKSINQDYILSNVFNDLSIDKILSITTLFAFFIIPSQGIGSITAEQRLNTLITSSVIQSNSNKENFFGANTLTYTIRDWISNFGINSDPKFYENKKVNVDGFIFKPNDLPKDYFLVSRFIIRCCAADATPVGIYVFMPGWDKKFRENTWVNIKGKFITKTINQVDLPTIEVLEINEIPKPINPYI